MAGGALDEFEERGGEVAHDAARDGAAGARDEPMGPTTFTGFRSRVADPRSPES